MSAYNCPYQFVVRHTDTNGKIIIISVEGREIEESQEVNSCGAYDKTAYVIRTTMDETKHFNTDSKVKEKYNKVFGYFTDYTFNGFTIGGTYDRKMIVGRLTGTFDLWKLMRIEFLKRCEAMVRLYNDDQDRVCDLKDIKKKLDFVPQGFEFDFCELAPHIFEVIETQNLRATSSFDDAHLKRIRSLR